MDGEFKRDAFNSSCEVKIEIVEDAGDKVREVEVMSSE